MQIDLGAVFATAYERGRFGRRISYHIPCPAPLSEAAQRWAEGVVARK
jgi:hypothetical protein